MKIWILVFAGGGVGSLFRYLMSRWISGNFFPNYPFFGTLIVNITGCLLIGFFVFYFTEGRFGPASTNWRLLLVTGLCGGYTTFSSFSLENIQLIENRQILTFLGYTFASLIFGFLATYSGIVIAKAV
jgi:CrcB protein